jgi:hypothetical protein
VYEYVIHEFQLILAEDTPIRDIMTSLGKIVQGENSILKQKPEEDIDLGS